MVGFLRRWLPKSFPSPLGTASISTTTVKQVQRTTLHRSYKSTLPDPSTTPLHSSPSLSSSSSTSTLSSTFSTSTSSLSTTPEAPPLITEEIYGRRKYYHNRDSLLLGQWERKGPWKHIPLVASFASWLRAMFLPINYPHSVHGCYLKFHAWQALETSIAACCGVLCNQAMLTSLGLTQTAATAGAVAIQWVLKDGIAEVGKLLFIKQYARSFDSHPKTWKAVGEVLVTFGSGLQLCTLLASPNFFLLFAASGNVAKSISWALWGATHSYFVRNFALTNNIGDVSAKSDAQCAAAQILGWVIGIGLISYSHTPAFIFAAFAGLTPVHALSTWQLLKSAQFEILNQSKTMLIIKQFLADNTIPSMQALRPKEYFFGEYVQKSTQIPRVALGVTVDKAFRHVNDLQSIVNIMKEENYLLNWNGSNLVVVFHRDAGGRDFLKSLLHSMKLHELLLNSHEHVKKISNESFCPALSESLNWTQDNYPSFVAKLDAMEWQSESVLFNDPGYRSEWDKAPGESHPTTADVIKGQLETFPAPSLSDTAKSAPTARTEEKSHYE